MSVITTFSLGEKDLMILEKVAKEYGGMSRSAALRFIIRDWARMRGYVQEENERDQAIMEEE